MCSLTNSIKRLINNLAEQASRSSTTQREPPRSSPPCERDGAAGLLSHQRRAAASRTSCSFTSRARAPYLDDHQPCRRPVLPPRLPSTGRVRRRRGERHRGRAAAGPGLPAAAARPDRRCGAGSRSSVSESGELALSLSSTPSGLRARLASPAYTAFATPRRDVGPALSSALRLQPPRARPICHDPAGVLRRVHLPRPGCGDQSIERCRRMIDRPHPGRGR